MIRAAFHAGIYLPLYNGLVFLIGIVPHNDVGIAVIILTLLVKLILLPLSLKVARTQEEQRKIAPLLEDIKKKYKGDRQAEATATMSLYKEHGIQPFAGILLLFVQLPILFGLYFVFSRGGIPSINPHALYSFVPDPGVVNMHFLGSVDLAGKSLVFAILAGLSQFVYAAIATPPPAAGAEGFQADMAKSMNVQIRYVLPVIIGFFAYHIAAAVSLYWITSNLFMIAQEYYVRWKIRGSFKSLTSK